MPDFLGSTGGAEEQGESIDFLGRQVPLAFKSQPALPAGGGAPGASAAPPSVAGAGTVAGPSAAGAAGTRGAAGGESSLALLARALGVSEQALKTADWAKKLFGGDKPTGEPTLTNFPQMQSGPGAELENAMDDATFAALAREAMAGQGAGAGAEAGAGGAGGAGPASAAGLVGSALGLAGGISGNRDVSMAGSTASAAANLGSLAAYGAGAAGAGAGAAGAIPALLFSGLQMEHDMSEAARIKRDIANVKNVLGAKVPSAMSRLGKTLNDISSLDPASATTEQLIAAQQQLQAARTEFNEVDAAFKGTLLVGNKPVQTGLSLDMVKPQLDALNESQLRIQDALESRGLKSEAIPGYQSPMDWLNFVAPDFYNSVRGVDANALKNFERDPAYYGLDPNDPTLAMARELGAIQPGQTEAGLRGYVAGHRPAETSPALQRALRAAFGDPGSYAEAASHVDAP